MKTRLSALLPLSLVGILGLATLVGAQSTPSPLGIVPTPTPQPVGINVWTDKTTYVVSETMRVYFNVNQPAYIYLYDIQPDGVVRRIFPNAYSQSNFVSAGTHILPDHPSYQYTVTHPTGEEKIQIFASLTPLALAPSVYGDPFPMVAPEEIQGHIMGISPGPTCQPTWATAWASSTITEPRASCPPPTCYAPPPPSYTPPTVLHAIASLSASLWLLLPGVDLVLPKCAMVFWSANSHRFLRPVGRDSKRGANSSPSCRRGSRGASFTLLSTGLLCCDGHQESHKEVSGTSTVLSGGWMLCRNWLFGIHHTTNC